MSTGLREITIPGPDGAIPAVIRLPEALPAPAVVIIPPVFGIDGNMLGWIERYAERGFICIAIDPFWRTLPGPLDSQVPGEREKATARNKAFDRDEGVRDIAAVRDYALAAPESNGTWAAAGYCFGGRYTLLAGAYLGANAVAGFHPSRMNLEFDAAAMLTCPASYHFGDADASVPMDVVQTIQASLENDPLGETFVYPGVKHGFTGTTNPAYDREAAETSFERATRMFDQFKTA